ncbi:hypothetical protein M0N77_11655 [Psychrobacter sp. AH5]|uniref:DUF6880 family protein n=1 Tax=Psychrobacter sp. AH5 TaxID=2937433 RepID=UPI0033418DB4
MLDAEQKQALAKLPKATLVNFVAEVQGVDKLLDKKIERLLLQSDTPKLIKKLTSNLKGLRRRHAFVEYWKVSEFVTELQYLSDDIMTLYPEQVESCLNLLELFIESSNSSLQRCEDSSEVARVYRSAAQSWLMVASSCYSQEKTTVPVDEQDILSQAWQSRVKTLIDDNDYGFGHIYGTKEALIEGINELLSESEISELINDYKQYYESLFEPDLSADKEAQSLRSSHSHNRANHQEKRKTEVTLVGLVKALSNVAIFEKVYLRIYPKDSMALAQLNELLTFMVDNQAYEIAEQYLSEVWQSRNKREQLQRLDWLSEIQRLKGETQAQIQTLKEAFELHASPQRLKSIMAIASPAEQAKLRKLAYQLVEQQSDIILAVTLLLEIGETKLANQVAVTRHLEFVDIHYETLTRLLKELPDDTYLIRVIIYRSLLSDILDNGRSKAYGHAARYYKKLLPMDFTISRGQAGYNGLASHQQYTAELMQKHGKKYSFWERIED